MIYVGPAAPLGVFVEPNAPGTVLTSIGVEGPPVFVLAPARITSRLAIHVVTAGGDQVVFTMLPAKYELATFRAFDPQYAVISCSIELRTASGGGGTVVSTLNASAMHPGQSSVLGDKPVIPMLTQPELYVYVADPSSKPNSLSLLLQVLDLTVGEVVATPWQTRTP